MNRIIATLALAAAAFTSTMALGRDTETYPPTVPLMLPATDNFLQSFVRLINKSDQAGEVRITAVDDGGNVYDTVTVQLAALQTFHFNSGDLTDGNAKKGVDGGIGAPMRGTWRLTIDTTLDVEALSYTRARDGFLTATHELLPAGDDGYLVKTFNPASNETQQSRLRLINWGAEDETVQIEGVDDGGNSTGPVSLTLPAGQSRTLTAIDLEQGAEGLEGMLGDGTGKWQLIVRGNAGSIVAQSLLYASSGHVSNLSAAGFAVSRPVGDLHGNSIGYETFLAIGGEQPGWIYPAGDVDLFGVNVPESGTLTVYTTGSTDTRGELQPGAIDIPAYEPYYTDNDRGEGTNFRMEADVADGGYYYISVAGFDAATGSYTLHTEFVQDDHGDLHGNDFFDATMLAIDGAQPGRIYPVHDVDWFRINVADSGTLTVYTTGYFPTLGNLYDVARRRIARYQGGGQGGEDTNFRISRRVDAGTYFVTVRSGGSPGSDGRYRGRTGDYAIHAEFTPN